MSDADLSDLLELRNQARALPYGATRVALLQEAVERADSLNHILLAYELRSMLVETATFSGRPDLLLVAFAWMRSQYDRDPTPFNSYSFLWQYKWVIGNSTNFPEISRAQIEELLSDFEARVRTDDHSPYCVFSERRDANLSMHDLPAAIAAHTELQRLRPDHLSDCSVCRVGQDCRYWIAIGEPLAAIDLAEDALARKLRCEVQPLGILCRLLNPLLELDRTEQAWHYQRRAQKLLAKCGNPMTYAHAHLCFFTKVGELARGMRLMERHLPAALASPDLSDRFVFLHESRRLLLAQAAAGKTSVRFRWPEAPLEASSSGKYETLPAARWFEGESRSIARRFDLRNGNRVLETRVDELNAKG